MDMESDVAHLKKGNRQKPPSLDHRFILRCYGTNNIIQSSKVIGQSNQFYSVGNDVSPKISDLLQRGIVYNHVF